MVLVVDRAPTRRGRGGGWALVVMARGGVAVALRPVQTPDRSATNRHGYWAKELHKSRLCAIRRAVRGIELETNNDRASVAIDSDEESWHSAQS